MFVNDGNGNKRAISWSPTGYSISTNGSVADQDRYPTIFPDPAHDTTGKTIYYVSASTGDNGNNGLTKGAPLKTIGAVNDLALVGGDEVRFLAGDTWSGANLDETLNPERDGDIGNYIKFTRYGDAEDADPIFDGGGTAHVACQTWKSYQWYDHLDFYNFDAPPFGTVRIYATSVGIHMTDCTVRGSNGQGIYTTGDQTQFIRCTVKDHWSWGIHMVGDTDGPRGRAVAYCTVTNCAAAPDGATGTEAISGPKGDDIICGNYLYNNNTSDHWIYRGWSAAEWDGAAGLCRIYNNILDMTSGTPSSSGSIASKGRGSRMFRNITMDGGTNYAMGLSAAIASAADGGTPHNLTYCHHNVIYELPSAGENGCLTMTAINFKQGIYGLETGTMHNWNNTCDSAAQGIVITGNTMGGGTNHEFSAKNNLIVDMRTYGAELTTVADTTNIDSNYYHGNPETNPFYVEALGNRTFAEWQAAGYDVNGVDDGGDPLFDDDDNEVLASRNYGLLESSPARMNNDGGDVMTTDDAVELVTTDTASWIGINYVPHATTPDVGAYQYLSGKKLDFSKYILGLLCNSGTASEFKLWAPAKTEDQLNTLTGA